MKHLLALLIITVLCASQSRAEDVKVEAAIQDTEPATSFAEDVPKLYASFKTQGTKKGDTLRGVWIAEDVGEAAPANTKIDESKVTADQDDFFGAFSLTKPTEGWPVGKYRVEIYSGDKLVVTVKFTITGGKSSKKESEGESSGE
jgi:hypothetical protein